MKENIYVYGKKFNFRWEPISHITKKEMNKMVYISNKIVKLERKKKMPIKIVTEKLIIDGKKHRGLVAWEGFLSLCDLPQEYIDSDEAAFYSNPRFHLNSSDKSKRILLIRCRDEQPLLEIKRYSEGEFQRIIWYIRKAGENLQKINQKLKLDRWKGKEEFII